MIFQPIQDFEWQEVAGVSGYEFQLAENSSFSSIVEESVEPAQPIRPAILTIRGSTTGESKSAEAVTNGQIREVLQPYLKRYHHHRRLQDRSYRFKIPTLYWMEMS